jgi:hypothetical protein
MEINTIEDYIKVITQYHLKSVKEFSDSISAVLMNMNKQLMKLIKDIDEIKNAATASSGKQ